MKEQTPPLIVTNDAVTLILDNKVYTGTRAYAEKAGVLVALKQRAFRRAAELLDKAKAIVRRSLGAFEVQGNKIFHNGVQVHNVVADRIVQLSDAGLPFMPMVKFLENILENPSNRATSEGYSFLEHKNLPVTEDGCFLAYKSVQGDYFSKARGVEPVEVSTDKGKTWKTFVGKIPNTVGSIVRMKRNLVDDNREHECSRGLHVGSLEYSGPNGWYHGVGDNVVIVKVNPRDIVSVPRDHNAQKLRVSQYEVVSDFRGAYEAPLTASNGTDFDSGASLPQVFCDDDECGWEGLYTELEGGLQTGYFCPSCGASDFLEAV